MINELLESLNMYKTENNISIISWILNNKSDKIIVMNCANDLDIDRKIVHRIFRDLSNKKILKEYKVNGNTKLLNDNGFSPFTRKIYSIDEKGIFDFIEKKKVELETSLEVLI